MRGDRPVARMESATNTTCKEVWWKHISRPRNAYNARCEIQAPTTVPGPDRVGSWKAYAQMYEKAKGKMKKVKPSCPRVFVLKRKPQTPIQPQMVAHNS